MIMQTVLLAAMLLFSPQEGAQEAAPAWQDLFDGRTLDGWARRGGAALYCAEEGCIAGASVPRTANTFLCTERLYGDFILEYEFKVDPELNSGVQIRSFLAGERVTGYQVEIDMDPKRDRFWTAGLYEERRRGWLDDLSDNEAARAAHRLGEWNQVRVEALGDRIRTWLNGVPAADLVDPVLFEGFIGLQVHGVGERADPLVARWRNLRIQDLGRHRWRRFLEGPAAALESAEAYLDATLAIEFRLEGCGLVASWGDIQVRVGADRGSGEVRAGEVLLPWQIAAGQVQVMPADPASDRLTLSRHGRRVAAHLNGVRLADLETAEPAAGGSALKAALDGQGGAGAGILLLEVLAPE
ncbi:MAG: DUF1080 domain-containing protein [Planctomycetes bacterium]|nr:DUF1080 domain-containing protein [Planctomycetota bacterium]